MTVPSDAPPVAGPAVLDGSVLAGLLGQIAAGDTAAFDQLYASTISTVLRISRSVVLDQSQAEEITQEVFLEIWRHAGRFDPSRGSATSWIWRVAHARAVDRVRHAQSARINDQRYAQHHFERDVDSVVDQVLRNSDVAALHTVLTTLTALQLQAMLLTYYAGLTNLQASALLGIPLATLKSRVLAALAVLRRSHPGYEPARS